MVSHCRGCKSPYWRYRADWPPSGYCCLPCSQKKAAPQNDTPPTPAEVIRQMRAHRLEAHETESMLAWFDCEQCDQYESLYASAIEWHFTQATAEMLAAGAGL